MDRDPHHDPLRRHVAPVRFTWDDATSTARVPTLDRVLTLNL
ncbi:hypothetical protein [Nocardia arizonensis]|nr:hypothetical protein [Nocardia arizonensis]